MTFKKRSSLKIVQSVLFALVLREMRSRFGAKRFGAFWMLFEPIFHIVVLLTIFSFRGRLSISADYPAFLISGLIPFFLMRNIVMKGKEAVNANRGLLVYKQIKPLDTILARCIMEVALYACVYLLFMIVMYIWFDLDIFMVDPIRWLGVMGLGIVFCFSLAVLFCLLIDILPEFDIPIRILFMILYFLSGVIFPIWMFPDEILDVILWNPFVHIIDELRQATFQYYPDHIGVNIYYPIKLTFFLLFISLGLYRVRRLKLVAI